MPLHKRSFCKGTLLVFAGTILIFLNAQSLSAQWTTTSSGDAVNNNSSGKVGIGISATYPAPDFFSLRSTTNGGAVNVSLDGWTNGERGLVLRSNTGTSPSIRWKIGSPYTTGGEPGGNIGTDFGIERFNDSGTTQGFPFFIQRSSGNVGIGTSAPADSLHVNNVVRISPYSPNTSGSYVNAGAALRLLNGNIYENAQPASIQFGGMYNPTGTTPTDAVYNYINWSYGWLRIKNNQQTKIQIGGGDEWGNQNVLLNPDGGNVGIGTTSPGSLLNLAGAFGATPPFIRLQRTDGTTTYYGGLDFYSQNGTKGWSIENNVSVGNDYLEFNKGASNKVVFDPNGNVGIGTTNPQRKFEVAGITRATASETVGDGSDSIGAGPYRAWYNLAVTRGWAQQLSASNNLDFWYYNGSWHKTATIDTSGNLTLSGSVNAKYQDVAEWVPSSEQLSAGTVVVLDSTKSNQVTSSLVSYDTRVAGVVSEQPGISLGEKSDNKVLVATTGRVRVKVDASKGAIHIGDLLVTSDVPGMAMKSEPMIIGGRRFHAPGTLIGKALEPLDRGTGTILVLLSLQ